MDALWSTIAVPAFATFFVIIDPVGLAPMFLTLTSHMSPRTRRKTALRAVVLAYAVLLIFALFGKGVLHFLGISLPAFRIAGGILLFVLALEMLFERRGVGGEKKKEKKKDENKKKKDNE